MEIKPHLDPFMGNIYLTPWTTDDERYKKYWWHNTPFAHGPIKKCTL